MAPYEVYLESSAEGLCMAHVPGLPGCFARGEDREQALRRLPDAIAGYHAWLVYHGVPSLASQCLAKEQIKFRVVHEIEGVGPFDPGDAAALFPPDRAPVTPEEMEHYLRLMDCARSDLLALAHPLPEALLGWQPYPDWLSIRRVLRHVGNAEQWYVSRLAPPESLPSEWDHDEDLPLFDFLEMERRTAVARLRQLTPAERVGIFYPTAWTRHPEEPWTLRKVLRRFLEHEREHTAQVRQILDLYRHGLLACLAATGTALLEPLLGLDEQVLTGKLVVEDRTASDLLADLAARDRREMGAMAAGEGGASPDLSSPGRLGEVLARLAAAQSAWLSWLEALPEEALFPQGAVRGAVDRAMARSRRLQAGRACLATWREGLDRTEAATPSVALLRAALVAGRQELLAAADLVPGGEEDRRPVCGTWTLKDVLGHVADWELFGVEGLRYMAAGDAAGLLQVPEITDIDAWNEAHVTARRGQPWAQVWADLVEARQALLETLEAIEPAALARRFRFPWGQQGTPYRWLRVYLAHDREHAADLRDLLTLPEIYSSP